MTTAETDQREEIVALAATLARERYAARALELANTHEYPYDVFDELAKAGFFGLYHDPRWGGLGLDLYTICRVVEELSAVSNTYPASSSASCRAACPSSSPAMRPPAASTCPASSPARPGSPWR